MSLFAVCYSKFKHVSRWTKLDLDLIIEEADHLYKNLNILRYLSIAELPRIVQV